MGQNAPMTIDKDLQRIQDAVEALGRLFQKRKPASLRAALAGVDLTRTEQQLLGHIVTKGPIRISDLAREVGIADAAASRQVSALVSRGFVERLTTSDDGRVSLVRTTQKGRATGRRLRKAANEIFRELIAGWSAKDLTDAAEHLERLVDDLGKRPEQLG